jgi:zinc and cadmium transporter
LDTGDSASPPAESTIVNPESSILLVSPTLTLILYCFAIVVASLLGGWLPMLVRLTHKRMELALSFVSGVMVGVATLLLIPHAFAARLEASPIIADEESHSLAHDILGPVMLSLLAGFLVMFFIERFFCFHHHEAPGELNEPTAHANEHDHAGCAHGHAHDHRDSGSHAHAHSLSWGGAAIGLTLHSLLDGVALAASVAAIHHGESDSAVLAGLGTFLVIFLHKPFDSLTLGTLMAAGRKSSAMRHAVNLIFALLTPIGAGLFMLGVGGSGEGQSQSLVLSIALAFAAGTFLCIALSDLLPELQFHQHDRVKLSIALVLGLLLAWGVAEMEARTHGRAEAITDGEADHKH